MARSTRGLVALLAATVLLLPVIAPPPARGATGATLITWGNNPPPEGMTDVVAVDVANGNGLALTSDGIVVEWSPDPCGYGLQPPAGLADVTAVSAAGTYSMALKSDGTVVAWGGWPCGQFDPGPGGYITVPAGLDDVKAIAAGDNIALALKTDGTVVAWNWGPVALSPAFGSNVAAVAAGGLAALALKADGTVVGWDVLGGEFPTDVSNAVAVAVGDGWDGGGGGQLLVLKADGTVVGWGDNSWGKAQPPEGLTGVTAIAAATHHSLALKSDGTVVGWGLDDYQVVSGPAALQGVTAIVAGGQESIAFVGATFDFTGFFAPVDNDRLNVAKAGSAIPVRFSLGGDQGLDIFATGYPKAVRIACDTGEPVDALEEYVVASTSGLTYDAASGRYQYNWKTTKGVTGCFQLRLGVTDGSLHTADFKLK